MIGRNKNADQPSSKWRTARRWGVRIVALVTAIAGGRKAIQARVPQRAVGAVRTRLQPSNQPANEASAATTTKTNPTPPNAV